MQQINMMYHMCFKLKEVFEQITQMYEEYAKKKGLPINEPYGKPRKISKRNPFCLAESAKVSPYELRRSINQQINMPATQKPAEQEKQSYSYKERISAFRRLSMKDEEELTQNEIDFQQKQLQNKRKNTAFFLFLHEKRDAIRIDYPELKNKEVIKILSQVWHNMTQQEKQAYEKQNKSIKAEFDKKFGKYLQAIVKLQKSKSKEYLQEQENDK